MNKEFMTFYNKETAVRIRNTKIEAVRSKDILAKGVRVFDDGKIGIAGALGNIADAVLVDNAVNSLSAGIEYPYSLTQDNRDHRNYKEKPISPEELYEHAESILDILRREYADFDFSETISITEENVRMHNTCGLDLEYEDAYFSLGLLLKEKKSANLFDGSLSYSGRRFDPDTFWTFNRSYLEAYRRRVDLPKEDVLPVFTIGAGQTAGFLTRSLNGERYAAGSSLFSGRIGEQLFHEKVNLEQNRDPRITPRLFFDMEGVVMPDDRCVMIENGRLVSVFTDKKNAALYNLPHTGSASGAYDGVPVLSAAPLQFVTDSGDLKKALNGQLAVLIVVSSGGDFTPDGSFAAPVQVGFLFDGENILGKLPEFTVRSHLNKMLGEDYIGTFDNTQLYFSDFTSQLQGYNMTIVR